MGDVLKAFMISNVINDDNAMCAAIVTVGNGPEALLACSIPLMLGKENTRTSLHFSPLTSIYLTF